MENELIALVNQGFKMKIMANDFAASPGNAILLVHSDDLKRIKESYCNCISSAGIDSPEHGPWICKCCKKTF